MFLNDFGMILGLFCIIFIFYEDYQVFKTLLTEPPNPKNDTNCSGHEQNGNCHKVERLETKKLRALTTLSPIIRSQA